MTDIPPHNIKRHLFIGEPPEQQRDSKVSSGPSRTSRPSGTSEPGGTDVPASCESPQSTTANDDTTDTVPVSETDSSVTVSKLKKKFTRWGPENQDVDDRPQDMDYRVPPVKAAMSGQPTTSEHHQTEVKLLDICSLYVCACRVGVSYYQPVSYFLRPSIATV